MNDPLSNARDGMKPETISRLFGETGRQGQLTVDSWAATDPKRVKAWEADGSLIDRAKEANEQASKAERDGDP